MKSFVLALVILCSVQSFAAGEHEINRRNFLSLNSDLNEMTLVVHYPGGSEITNVCGLSLRTNFPNFANSHTEALVKEIQVLDMYGKELTANTRVAEPPFYALAPENGMGITYTVRTKSGESLRSVIRKTAVETKMGTDREPEIIVVARHCKDQS